MEQDNTAVFKTKDFDMFKIMECNRSVSPSCVRGLVNSIRKNNKLYLCPIIVNEHFEVLDGQHRLEAAKILHTEIYYTIDKEATPELIPLLNANQKAWTVEDFLNFWVHQGDINYVKFNEFCKKYKFRVSIALTWLKDGSTFTREQFKKGNFKYVSGSELTEHFLCAMHYIEYLKSTNFKPDTVLKTTLFHRALRIFLISDLVNKDEFIRKITVCPFNLRLSSCEFEYVSQFVDIYNYKQKSNRIIASNARFHIKIMMED